MIDQENILFDTQTTRRVTATKPPQTRPTPEQWDDGVRLLRGGNNAFLNHTVNLVGEYHALDRELVAMFCRGALRAAYSSDSALLHMSTSGASGSGKNDFITKIAELLPDKNKVMFQSITPRVLFYSTQKTVTNSAGKQQKVVDPDSYRNKVLIVTEIADSAAYNAIKSFAETNEYDSFIHATTSGSSEVKLTVQGPRAIWITSVSGVGDEQVQRRFIHTKISEDTKETRHQKADLVLDNFTSHKRIETDDRRWITKAAYSMLFDIGLHRSPVPMTSETESLLKELVRQLVNDGFKTTATKQFLTLAEVAAFEKRCYRNYDRIDVEDVLESWFLIQYFDTEPIVNEVKIGNTIYEPISPLFEEA